MQKMACMQWKHASDDDDEEEEYFDFYPKINPKKYFSALEEKRTVRPS